MCDDRIELPVKVTLNGVAVLHRGVLFGPLVRLSPFAKPRYRFNTGTRRWAADNPGNFAAVPRSTRWNKPDCLSWYSEGCPPRLTFMTDASDQTRRVVGYDPTNDTLILGETLHEYIMRAPIS